MREKDQKFTWVQTHKELANYLSGKEDDQKELIDILKNAGIEGFKDKNSGGNTIDLEVIDPFTFYCYIYIYGAEKRLKKLQNVADQLGLTIPEGESGLPSVFGVSTHLFPQMKDRQGDEIDKLWALFQSVLEDSVTDDQFDEALNIKGVGQSRLTEAFFYVDPEKYFPIDGPTKPYLKEVLGIDPKFNTWSEYLNILEQVKRTTDKPFYEISYDAWVWNNEQKKVEDSIPELSTSKWKELLTAISKINNEEFVRKFFKTIRFVLKELQLTNEDEITYASCINNFIQFTVGRRYVSKIYLKNNRVLIGFYIYAEFLKKLQAVYPSIIVSDKAVDNEGKEMLWVDVEASEAYEEDFFDGILSLARRSNENQDKSQFRFRYPERHNPWIINAALNNELLENLLNGDMPDAKLIQNQKPLIKYPLNTIFYGPPGTGKTYNTIKRAAEIVKSREIESYDEAKQIFNDNLRDTIEFITFHQNYSYEDFIQGLRPDTENDKELTFDRVDGVFKVLADKALKNLKTSKSPQTRKMSFEQVFNKFVQPLVEGEVEELEIKMKRVSYFITAVTNRSIEFRKTSGASNHTLSISTLKKMYEAESVLEIQGLSSYYSPLLDKLLEIGKTPGVTETVQLKNYVLIIDEINRANISRVFGELITLIEPDKRYGRELFIPARLPSGEEFSVPENLYIIGTMNTADKSIALLDIALRRRFEFEAMYPKYEIDGHEIHDVDVLKKINDRIIKLKGHDFQIGHSYFMNNELTLTQRMNRKVIPLLLEYFMNDAEEVQNILIHAGIEIEENTWPIRITGKV